MKKEKEIPLKNYILLSIVLILTIVVVIYFFLWKNTYEKSKLQTPILDDYLLVINYNELNNYLVENKDAIIYISKLNNENIRLFENKFKNIINKNLCIIILPICLFFRFESELILFLLFSYLKS